MAIELFATRTEDKQERTESRRFLRVPVAPIDEIDPVLVGVDRAEQVILPGGGVPRYVPRTADARLRETVRAALDGEPWIIVVRGVAKVGKSRSLFEAVRAASQWASIDLVAPANGKALESLLTPGVGLRLPRGRAVLWLDDLEPFLDDGVTLQRLHEWHAGVRGRIVAATYGGKGAALVRGSRTTGLSTIAQQVLQHPPR
ncbi:MAG TPA: hypothetical protein VGR26_18555 [Acidimicrobiales bacterium]|nr:hypothetical protein [Acidimicrobiales bacterium]